VLLALAYTYFKSCKSAVLISYRNGTYNASHNEVRFGNYTPALRDTTMLYRYATSGQKNYTSGWRAWRIRVTENDVGAWMMHCHIVRHPKILQPSYYGTSTDADHDAAPTYDHGNADSLGVWEQQLDIEQVPHATSESFLPVTHARNAWTSAKRVLNANCESVCQRVLDLRWRRVWE
jgi:hypothetical protein